MRAWGTLNPVVPRRVERRVAGPEVVSREESEHSKSVVVRDNHHFVLEKFDVPGAVESRFVATSTLKSSTKDPKDDREERGRVALPNRRCVHVEVQTRLAEGSRWLRVTHVVVCCLRRWGVVTTSILQNNEHSAVEQATSS
jgi:hypothetical protein